jgi:ATP phosphoribosyltransferase
MDGDIMQAKLRLAIPKGRIMDEVGRLLAAAGIRVSSDGRSYRPVLSDPEIEAKFLKPQNIPRLIEIGAHDCGFTGHDWIVESGADIVESLDTGLDPVTLVAAAHEDRVADLDRLSRPIVVASEFETITRRYMDGRGRPWLFIRTHGATEVFPPEDADLILDLRASGLTLRENRLVVVDEVLRSTTRFVASRAAVADPWKAGKIESIRTLMAAVLEARRRILLEMNVPADRLQAVVAVLPSMKSPTIQELYGGAGYAVKSAVPRDGLSRTIQALRQAGATDLIAYALEKVIP